MILAGLLLILGVREYLFRLYALLPAGLPAGRLRSNSSVWQAQRGRCWFGRLRGYVSGPTLGLDERGKEFALGALHGLCGGQVSVITRFDVLIFRYGDVL